VNELYAAIGAFIVGSGLNLYWDILKPVLSEIWSVPTDGVAWKMRQSLIAAAWSVWDMLKSAYKRGLLDAIISIIVKLIRAKLGVPVAIKRVGAVFNK
jgi:hypothetical protein